jgi:RepB DNA-primase from phage plasmid
MNIDATFGPRSLTASQYVSELFAALDNAAVLVRNRSTRHTVQRITRAGIVASPSFQYWLTYENARGSDVFIGMNPIKDGACSRTKANIREIRHLYLDLDSEGDHVLGAIRKSTELPPPTFVLQTSPGKHQVVWRVTGIDQDRAELLMRSLADRYAADPAATDSTRVLRLPGFANRKLPGEFIVQARYECDAVYTLRDFVIGETAPEMPRNVALTRRPTPTVSAKNKTQSERDWAFAKRALSRGEDPSTVIQRIAAFRGKDKPSPEYYARLTVNKAKAALG